MDDMLTGYNRKHRPVMNQSKPVIVNITCDVISIHDFDEVNGVLSFVLLLYTQWYDEIIWWDPASYGGIQSQIYDVEDVWYPLIVVASSAKKPKGIVEDWMSLRIYSTGLMYFTPGLVVRSFCSPDVTFYPFDEQICAVTLYPWSEFKTEILLQSPNPHALSTFYTEHGEWSISNNATYLNHLGGYILKLVLQRKPLFAVVNIILPILFMSILNLMVFAIPVESGERISYTITVLLAMAVFLTLVAESMPKTSKPMSILSFYLMTNIICSMFTCIGTVWTVVIHFRKATLNVPQWQRKLVRALQCRRATVEPIHEQVDDTKGIPNNNATEDNGQDTKAVVDNTVHSLNDSISWQDVATALDRCLMVIFSLMIFVNTITFMIYIENGHERGS